MKTIRFLLAGAAIAAPAAAQPVQFSAVVSSDFGYAINPRLRPGDTDGSLFASASIAPVLDYKTERSDTVVQGHYTREKYFSHFGYTDSGSIGLTRTDQLAQFLSSTLNARYATSNRATIEDSDLLEDPLTIGRRTKTLLGGYQLQWQATGRDQFSAGGQIVHQSYGSGRTTLGGVASNYTQYSGNAGYNRTIDARTSVGAQVSVSATQSRIYPDSRVIQPSLTAKRQLTAIWSVDGHVGIVLQHIYGPFPRSSTSLGLGANLCGTYPHTRVCFEASRDTSPSGYGALRRSTRISASLSHDIDEHSRVSFDAHYLKSASLGLSTLTPLQSLNDSKAFLGSANYDRDVTKRISAGFGGEVQLRKRIDFRDAHSYTATIHVSAKLGRM